METNALSILVAASEVAPLAKAGGLGDVVGSLPLAFRDLGCRVAVVLPAYRQAMARVRDFDLAAEAFPVRLGKLRLTADALIGELAPGVPAYLVRREEFFDRSELYGNSRGEYFDNPERFIFFSRSIPALCSAVGFLPDIILCNDWHTGLVMALLAEGALPESSGIFTIHNMGYLGLVSPDRAENIGLPKKYYRMQGLEFYGRMSLLKAGIVYSKAVITVSPTYARDIQTPEFGAGLDGLMRSVSNRLHGILNGVDYQSWNPATDKHLETNYSPRDLAGKALCKQKLLKEMKLPDRLLDRPVAGIVMRLVDQKGCNLVAEAAEELFDMGLGLILLGEGDEFYHKLFSELRARYPDRFGLKLGFDQALAHKLIAGCDMLLVPSLYEPCGLTQMFSLKYGTIPIVRATGGLKDTVLDPNEGHQPGTGFKFHRFGPADLLSTVHRAVELFQDRHLWRAMMGNAMAQDFSWHRSAKEYLSVFKQILRAKRDEKT